MSTYTRSVLVLASPRLRLLDPATTMRYKHVCWDYLPIYRWGKNKKIIKIFIAVPRSPSYSVVSRSHRGDAGWCDPPLSPLDCPSVPVVCSLPSATLPVMCSLVAESPAPTPQRRHPRTLEERLLELLSEGRHARKPGSQWARELEGGHSPACTLKWLD